MHSSHVHTVGGANIPALNNLLDGWGMALSGEVLEGEFELADHKISYASGTSIARWPQEGVVIARDLNDQGRGNAQLHKLQHNNWTYVWSIYWVSQKLLPRIHVMQSCN